MARQLSVLCRAKKLPYIASMGIYVLKASAIRKLLNDHFPEVRAPLLLAAFSMYLWHLIKHITWSALQANLTSVLLQSLMTLANLLVMQKHQKPTKLRCADSSKHELSASSCTDQQDTAYCTQCSVVVY